MRNTAGRKALLKNRLILQNHEHTNHVGVGVGRLLFVGRIIGRAVLCGKWELVERDFLIRDFLIRDILICCRNGNAGQHTGDHADDQQQGENVFHAPMLHFLSCAPFA